MPRVPIPLLWLATVLAAGCARKGEPRSITVFASASLTEAMQAIAEDYEVRHSGVDVEVHCAGTPHLLMQVRQGATVDVFASADRASVERFARLADLAAPPEVLARNALAIVVPEGNPARIRRLADLQREDLLVALCGPRVPAGAYAREACERAGVVIHSRSDEPSVKAVVTKVRLGEFDAGVVYATDLVGVPGVEAVAIPPEHNVEVEVCIAVVEGERRGAARRFVDWALGDAGRRVLAAQGFELP